MRKKYMGKKFALNGYANTGGQMRMVSEMLRELDKWIEPGLIQIVIPHDYPFHEQYANMETVRFGYGNKFVWTQTWFFLYLVKYGRIGINLYNACPVLKPDVMTIYDMTHETCKKEQCSSIYGRLSYLYYKAMRFCAVRKSSLIFTVSKTSKKEIMAYYHMKGRRIAVLPNGWQHMQRISGDEKIFLKYPQLKKGEYYLSAGSLLPHKNFKWVREVSIRNPGQIFAVAGEKAGYQEGTDDSTAENLVYLGWVSDGEMKALMMYCKAYIHPALSEGFGIPPLEALCTGAQIIVSKKSCLPEIYENSAHYIDPYQYDTDLEALLKEPAESRDKILNKYSWEKAARKFYQGLRKTFG